mgnify:CR=1 FL=1
MKRIEAIIRKERLDDVRSALEEVNYPGMTLVSVKGHGRQKGIKEQFRGREYEVELLPKVEVMIVAEDDSVDEVVQAIVENARTDEVGDGKVFISEVERAIRIRTGEEEEKAL